MNTEKYIAELLYNHDCVILPGFGGFIGNHLPARIHPVNHTFLPPSKAILFNINLKHNDGLLASRVAFLENISYDEAMSNILEDVESWNRQLKENRILVIDQIGKLILKREGNIQFIQENSLNYLPDSFGLTSFVSPAIRRVGFQEKMEKKISRYIETPKTHRRIVPKPLKWAAVLILPIGLATYFGITNFNSIRNLAVNYSSLIYSAPTPSGNPAKSQTKTFEVKAPEVILPTTKIVPSEPTDNETVPLPTEVAETSLKTDNDKPFAIIVGAFRLQENADHLVTTLKSKGYNACILDTTRNGLVRVSIGTYSERTDALQELAAVRANESPSAWLLSR